MEGSGDESTQKHQSRKGKSGTSHKKRSRKSQSSEGLPDTLHTVSKKVKRTGTDRAKVKRGAAVKQQQRPGDPPLEGAQAASNTSLNSANNQIGQLNHVQAYQNDIQA